MFRDRTEAMLDQRGQGPGPVLIMKIITTTKTTVKQFQVMTSDSVVQTQMDRDRFRNVSNLVLVEPQCLYFLITTVSVRVDSVPLMNTKQQKVAVPTLRLINRSMTISMFYSSISTRTTKGVTVTQLSNSHKITSGQHCWKG